MNRKFLTLCCILLILISLCSCRLARENGLDVQKDRLVGAFITQEHVDLFDYESYIRDNLHTIGKNGEISVADNEQYGGRKYAELKSVTHKNEETGEEIETCEYVFEGLDGIPFFTFEVKQPDGESYLSSSSDSAISDGHITVGDNTTLEGTIYFSPNKQSVMYINPVFQGSDGRVYLTSGSGFSFSGDTGEGAAYTTTLEEKYTVTENGEATEESFRITINIAAKAPPDNITIIQMSSDNTPILQEEYTAAGLPKNVAINPKAEYVIVETQSNYSDGKINREIYSSEDEYFVSYTARDDGICEAKFVGLLWK
ncbi:MAG TPA: hypothetical protein GXZ37_05925 [Clostridiales bacterium]|jgi:hypothetical protein|nr:hypothetical protein [Clostridiales bacterium]